MASILYCGEALDLRVPDARFRDEVAAARAVGATTAFLDHDLLVRGHADAAVRRVPRDLGRVWYRGWTVTAAQYEQLAAALMRRGALLVTAPQEYVAAHELPGWYPTFAGATPGSAWLPSPAGAVPAPETLAALVAAWGSGPGVVRDFLTSGQHEWDEACFVPDLADTERLWRVVRRFVHLQGGFLAGGIVLRRFERYDRLLGEARVWWLDGRAVLVSAHPDTPGFRSAPALDGVRPLVELLGCRFVTTDLAMRNDGVWRVVAVGDGQVSELPRTTDPAVLAAALVAADDSCTIQEEGRSW